MMSCFSNDQSLVLFHALGKVLYRKLGPKAVSDGGIEAEQLVTMAHIDPGLFSLCAPWRAATAPSGYAAALLAIHARHRYLHENYMLFCTSIDDVVAAADCLCLSDHAATPTSHRHGLSQQAASLAIRGVHHANKQPSAARFQPLHKPAYFDVLKQQAELRAALLHDGPSLPPAARQADRRPL